jgi:BlaI family penicillinase repressor
MQIVLADREAELMEILWERGPSTVEEVRKALGVELAYNTVLTILRTLESKGYVGHKEEGRSHRYRPLVAREAARRSAVRHLAEKFFKGSAELLMASLVTDTKLSDEQAKRIRVLLDSRDQEKKK